MGGKDQYAPPEAGHYPVRRLTAARRVARGAMDLLTSRARVYDGKSGNRTSREASVKVHRYGVTNIIVASQ